MTQRTAIVTGAAQGIGYAVAHRLCADGMSVVLADINGDAADRACHTLSDEGYRVAPMIGDISDPEFVRSNIAALADNFGTPDVLVNNAGIFPHSAIDELDLAEWNKVLQINLTGCLVMAQAVLPHMRAGGWGRIVNMASFMAFTAFGRDAAYTTTKAGLLGLTRSIAAEYGADNIIANALCPGNIMTDMMEKVAAQIEERDGLSEGSFLDSQAASIPMRRLGEVGDVASVASFLCSDDAAYVTGQAIHVNGGLYYH